MPTATKPKTVKSVSGTFEVEEPKKNSVRFSELGEESSYVQGTAYVRNGALERLGYTGNEQVKITVELV